MAEISHVIQLTQSQGFIPVHLTQESEAILNWKHLTTFSESSYQEPPTCSDEISASLFPLSL